MASNREERKRENHFKVMRLLYDDPSISTREIASNLGISNGGAHYCVTALVVKCYVKLKNFTKSDRKAKYLYELTPQGVRAKAKLSVKFLDRKREEYRELKEEIERLKYELGQVTKDVTDDNRGPV